MVRRQTGFAINVANNHVHQLLGSFPHLGDSVSPENT